MVHPLLYRAISELLSTRVFQGHYFMLSGQRLQRGQYVSGPVNPRPSAHHQTSSAVKWVLRSSEVAYGLYVGQPKI
jgi:hypothetical protein